MLNHVVLMGRLTADPELHMIDAETQKYVCNVVIACERKNRLTLSAVWHGTIGRSFCGSGSERAV